MSSTGTSSSITLRSTWERRTIVIITFNLVVDILYAWIDPRIR
jgi:hypothetical protein